MGKQFQRAQRWHKHRRRPAHFLSQRLEPRSNVRFSWIFAFSSTWLRQVKTKIVIAPSNRTFPGSISPSVGRKACKQSCCKLKPKWMIIILPGIRNFEFTMRKTRHIPNKCVVHGNQKPTCKAVFFIQGWYQDVPSYNQDQPSLEPPDQLAGILKAPKSAVQATSDKAPGLWYSRGWLMIPWIWGFLEVWNHIYVHVCGIVAFLQYLHLGGYA